MEEQALEIGALTQAEEGRSFTSSSNQGLELHQPHLVPPGISRPTWESVGFDRNEPVNAPHLLNSPRFSVGSVSEVGQASPPLPPPPTSMRLSVGQNKQFPEVYAMSSRASGDPFKELVLVHGQPHRWVRVGDRLILEPAPVHGRERSPPPKSAPPPSHTFSASDHATLG